MCTLNSSEYFVSTFVNMTSLVFALNIIFFSFIHLFVYTFPVDENELIDLSTLSSSAFVEPDAKIGEILRNWKSGENQSNPEEIGSYFEGDILIPKSQSTNSRNGMVAQAYRWPNAVIPYEITGSFDSRSMNLIQNAMNMYHQKTCIKFQRRTAKDRDYINIQNAQSGCWSSIGILGVILFSSIILRIKCCDFPFYR